MSRDTQKVLLVQICDPVIYIVLGLLPECMKGFLIHPFSEKPGNPTIEFNQK